MRQRSFDMNTYPSPRENLGTNNIQKRIVTAFAHSRRRRFAVDQLIVFLLTLCSLIVLVSLFSIVGHLIIHGASSLTREFLTHLPKPVGEPGGGMANAIAGSLILLGIAFVVGVPVGVGAGIFLSEYATDRYASVVRFVTDVMNGIPSIVYGIFVYTVFVLPFKGFSAFSGGIALGMMMIPMITRTTEEFVRMVPVHLREAGLALGAPRWRVIGDIVISSSIAGIVTGIMVALARVAGETAPLLFTAFGNRFWHSSLMQPIAALPLQIFSYAISPFDDWHRQAWAGALVLIGIVFMMNLSANYFVFRRNRFLLGKNSGKTAGNDHSERKSTRNSIASPSIPEKLEKFSLNKRINVHPQSLDNLPVQISVKNLNFYYGRQQVLKDVSMNIPGRRVTALIGPSGCGISTLLRTFNRMNDLIPSSRMEGEVLIDGKNIYDKTTDVVALRQKVGMVFQKFTPFPKSIYDNVSYGLKIIGIKDKSLLNEMVEKSLRRAALWDEVKDYLGKSALALSGGQQQRLCIARALAVGPEILLMDEPCSALDPAATAKIEELIFELKDDYTIVIVTHNMQQAARVSDYTAFLFLGELVEFGSTEKMFTVPQDKRTEAYLTGKFG